MVKLHVKKVRSAINRTARQKKTLEALGLHKMNQVVEHDDSAAVQGMIAKVAHLVSVEKA
jgi:large subunit ribosomal protein L30